MWSRRVGLCLLLSQLADAFYNFNERKLDGRPKELVQTVDEVKYHIQFDFRNVYGPGPAIHPRSRYRGKISVTFNVLKDAQIIHMHSSNLTMLETSLRKIVENGEHQSQPIRLTLTEDQDEQLQLSHPDGFKAGDRFQLVADFEGRVRADLPAGLYVGQKMGAGGQLLHTQFTPTHARSAFPCFDEPGVLASFTVVLLIPRDLEAVSGTKIANTELLGDFQRIEFAETKPVATHAFGFAVGQFQAISKRTASGITVNWLTLKESDPPSSYRLDAAVSCVEMLQRLTRRPFPTSNLTLIATHNQGFSSQAHGLVFLSEFSGHMDEDGPVGPLFDSLVESCHEVAHQVFGDLVGVESWSDVFVSESLASYYAQLSSESNGTVKVGFDFLGESLQTFQNSRVIKKKSRALSAMVWSDHALADPQFGHFDAVTYKVGPAVLRMIHHVLGRELFEAAVQQFIDKNQNLVASIDEFVQSLLAATAGHSVCNGMVDLSQFLHDYLYQTDHPIVYIDLVDDEYRFNVSATSSNNRWIVPLHVWDDDTDKVELIWILKDGSVCKPNANFQLHNDRLLVFDPFSTDFVAIQLSPTVLSETCLRLDQYFKVRTMDNMVLSSLTTQLSKDLRSDQYQNCLLSVANALDPTKVPLQIVKLVLQSGFDGVFVGFVEKLYAAMDWKARDGFDEETEIRYLVLQRAIKANLSDAVERAWSVYQQVAEVCDQPCAFKQCHKLPASIRMSVYAAALIKDLRAKDLLAQHLHALKQDSLQDGRYEPEVELLSEVFSQFDYQGDQDRPRKCYPIHEPLSTSTLARMTTE